MNISFLLLLFIPKAVTGFVVAPKLVSQRQQAVDTRQFVATPKEDLSYFSEGATLDEKLEWIAHHLKLEVYDPDTSVYGFGSKDPKFGIENIRVSLPVVESSLGLDLVELAHGEQDSRGLVLVNKVLGKAVGNDRIHPGDTIIGVFVGDKFKQSTTALNLEETMNVLEVAKAYATDNGITSLDLELNRLVKRETVKVVLEQDWRDDHGDVPTATEIEALAGDNLRTLLMHHNARVYDERTVRVDTLGTGNCGGEGICGTCMVEVLEGMEGKLVTWMC